MRAYVGVTDANWASFLASRPALTEVNFWKPGGQGFKALAIGEPFAFKTHYPHNQVVGVGFFAGSAVMKVSEAWRFFGEGNGVTSQAEMRKRIAYYRPSRVDEVDPEIGCVMLRDVAFLPASAQLPPPSDWSSNIVQGKSYPVEGSSIEGLLQELMLRTEGTLDATGAVPGAVFGDPRLARNRLGQGSFKAMVLQAYRRRCAITQDKIVPVLQASHIRPVSQEGENRLDNGILLRSDVHTLFDEGYIGLDNKYRLRVSPALRSEFGNGEEFYSLAGLPVAIPERRADRPAPEFLEWHSDVVYRSA